MVMEEQWKKEPDYYSFNHMGYQCVAQRQATLRHWLGCVIIPTGHPWFGVDKAEFVLPVHGGIVITDHCPFAPDPRQDEWWVGIECNQPFDLVPKDWETESKTSPDFFKGHQYRNLEFVVDQLKILAELAKKVSTITRV